MFTFTTIRCSICGAVICNLPDVEAKKLKSLKFQCEDCSNTDIYKDSEHYLAGRISSKPVRISA